MENKKIAILFFGLTRTLEKTIDSIKTNLFTSLDENLIHYDSGFLLNVHHIHHILSN